MGPTSSSDHLYPRPYLILFKFSTDGPPLHNLYAALHSILAAAAAGRLPGLPELAHWRVLVTGHSLGAGLAALMTWALKPDLKGRVFCWAYEPPVSSASDSNQLYSENAVFAVHLCR